METLKPRDRYEQVAIFRAEIVGALVRTPLTRGELRRRLKALSRQHFRPPGSPHTRTYGYSTLQRWYYAYKAGGLEALTPRPRADRGHGRTLTDEFKTLLLNIRRDHRHVPATVIRDALIDQGRMDPADASVATVQRLYREHDLPRLARGVHGDDGAQRLRWQAAHPGALWHGDVCHGPSIVIDGQKKPLRIHALMDDASRYVVALEAHHTEREMDLIGLLADTLRRHGAPDAFYLDNGSTYRGEALSVACSRLGVGLLHAKPYDPRARGKMERFWRTLRERVVDHLDACTSLHDVNVRLWAFVKRYHDRSHAGLMGRTPDEVWRAWWQAHPAAAVDEARLRDALTVRKQRRVRGDSTLSHDGCDFECDQSFLSKKNVTVAHCLLDRPPLPWIEHQEQRFELHPVDPVKNGQRGRRKSKELAEPTTPFDAASALLDRSVGRHHQEDER